VYNKTRKYDNVHVATKTLVKAVLNVSLTGCNTKRESFAKLSYSAVDSVLTNLLPAGLQDFFQFRQFFQLNRSKYCVGIISSRRKSYHHSKRFPSLFQLAPHELMLHYHLLTDAFL